MKMENRKRNVQVKFRLTQEESDALSKVISNSGMTRNDYIIQTLIKKVTMPMLKMVKKYYGNSVELNCKLGNQVMAYCRCSYYESLDQVEIHSLFVSKSYRSSELMKNLLDEVIAFAKEKEACSIKAICGCEPMSKSGQLSLEEEISFYEENGFVRQIGVVANIPVMVKTMKKEMMRYAN